MIFTEASHNHLVHVAKLRTMAFIKDDDYMLVVDAVSFLFLAEGIEFLNSGNHYRCLVVLQLFFQLFSGLILAYATFLELLVFQNGLIVKVFSVHYK